MWWYGTFLERKSFRQTETSNPQKIMSRIRIFFTRIIFLGQNCTLKTYLVLQWCISARILNVILINFRNNDFEIQFTWKKNSASINSRNWILIKYCTFTKIIRNQREGEPHGPIGLHWQNCETGNLLVAIGWFFPQAILSRAAYPKGICEICIVLYRGCWARLT